MKKITWHRIRGRLQYEYARLSRPQMIAGYRRSDGVYLKNTRISNTTFINHKQNLHIEDYVFIGHFNFIEASDGMTIEEGCQITNYVSITTHSSHISIRLYGRSYMGQKDLKGYVTGPVRIGRYTFIGPHSLIMPDTRIGKGSIVSAYSMVRGEFPDYSIIKGNPAEVVGDTRELDHEFIKDDPELAGFYESWAGKV